MSTSDPDTQAIVSRLDGIESRVHATAGATRHFPVLLVVERGRKKVRVLADRTTTPKDSSGCSQVSCIALVVVRPDRL
jgi:hypothetical protein